MLARRGVFKKLTDKHILRGRHSEILRRDRVYVQNGHGVGVAVKDRGRFSVLRKKLKNNYYFSALGTGRQSGSVGAELFKRNKKAKKETSVPARALVSFIILKSSIENIAFLVFRLYLQSFCLFVLKNTNK